MKKSLISKIIFGVGVYAVCKKISNQKKEITNLKTIVEEMKSKGE